MYIGFQVKYPLFASRQILRKLEFSQHIFKTLKYQISWKSIRFKPSFCMRVDAQTDRQTDRHTDRQTWRS